MKHIKAGALPLAIAFAALLNSSACADSVPVEGIFVDGGVGRAVVDASTGKPLGGAIVVFLWASHVRGLGRGGGTPCDRVETITVGPKGVYDVPKWKGRLPLPHGVYARNFFTRPKSSSEDSSKDDLLAVGPEDRLRRMNDLVRFYSRLDCPDDSMRRVVGVLRAVSQEYADLAQDSNERRFLQGIDGTIQRFAR